MAKGDAAKTRYELDVVAKRERGNCKALRSDKHIENDIHVG
jgi:hypothetical protein